MAWHTILYVSYLVYLSPGTITPYYCPCSRLHEHLQRLVLTSVACLKRLRIDQQKLFLTCQIDFTTTGNHVFRLSKGLNFNISKEKAGGWPYCLAFITKYNLQNVALCLIVASLLKESHRMNCRNNTVSSVRQDHTASVADKEALFLSADNVGIKFHPIFRVP